MGFLFSGFQRKPEKHNPPAAETLINAKSVIFFHRRWIKFHHFLPESDEKNL